MLLLAKEILTVKLTVVKFSAYSKKNLKNLTALKMVKSLATTDLLSCQKSCFIIPDCDAIITNKDNCQLITIFSGNSLIDDMQSNLHFKINAFKYQIFNNTLSDFFSILFNYLFIKGYNDLRL